MGTKPRGACKHFEACLKLNEAYQEQYRLTKDRLLTMPKENNLTSMRHKYLVNLIYFVDDALS